MQELSIYFGLVDFFKKNFIKFILKIVYKKSDLIIANSSKTAKDLVFFSKIKTKGIYPPSFLNKKYKNKTKNKLFNLLTIGRLSKEKGYNILIDIISDINFKNFKLTIIGNGPEKENLKKLVIKKGLKKKILFLGEKKNVNQYFKNCDLFILSREVEGPHSFQNGTWIDYHFFVRRQFYIQKCIPMFHCVGNVWSFFLLRKHLHAIRAQIFRA